MVCGMKEYLKQSLEVWGHLNWTLFKLKDDNELLQNKAAKAEESEEKLKQHNRRLPLGDGGGVIIKHVR